MCRDDVRPATPVSGTGLETGKRSTVSGVNSPCPHGAVMIETLGIGTRDCIGEVETMTRSASIVMLVAIMASAASCKDDRPGGKSETGTAAQPRSAAPVGEAQVASEKGPSVSEVVRPRRLPEDSEERANLLAIEPPRVVIETTMGDFKVELESEKCPETTANFLKYVDDGFYAESLIHRVVPGLLFAGGAYGQDFKERATLPPVEYEDCRVKNTKGTIAMARGGEPHSARAQFFINLEDNPSFDKKPEVSASWGYVAFGRVIAGMDVVEKIGTVATEGRAQFAREVPVNNIIIRDIYRVSE